MPTNNIHYVTTNDTWDELADITKEKFLDYNGDVGKYKETLYRIKLGKPTENNKTEDNYASEICGHHRNLLDKQKLEITKETGYKHADLIANLLKYYICMCKLCKAHPAANKEAPNTSEIRNYMKPDNGFRTKGLKSLDEYLDDGKSHYVWKNCEYIIEMSNKALESLSTKITTYRERLTDTL